MVELLDHDGNFLARGLVNPASRLRVRLYAFEPTIQLDAEFWQQRIDLAIARRQWIAERGPRTAQRLVFSESDLISGLIVDQYADCLSVQFTSAALLQWRDPILAHLRSRLQPRAMLVRLDEKTAKREGVPATEGWDAGADPGGPIEYEQNGLLLSVDLRGGQKTGGYLDQRVNHAVAAQYLADRRVLDVCCYTGGFGLVARRAGAASVVGVDSSQRALQEAHQAAERNGLDALEFRAADCFEALKAFGEAGEQFDAVILDPPRFAGSRHQIEAAIRAYSRLNSLAINLIPPGGILVTCSCSGRVSRADFLNMLLDVGRRRRRDLILLEQHGPAADHPVSIACPETDYLKCVIAQVR